MFNGLGADFLANSTGVRYKSSAVRTELAVVPSLALYFVSSILRRHEIVSIQTFVRCRRAQLRLLQRKAIFYSV